VIAERKDCNLHSWSLADRETQSQQHRGLSSGVASGKSVGVATPTVGWKRAPLSAVTPISGVIFG
jgi:3-deoxy-D-arabino-heptulosonate 7-phosphate (DAHP) synthase